VQLADKNGKAVQLTGWATHGLQWQSVKGYFDSKDDFQGMKALGATVVRLTCYITEGANWGQTEPWVKSAIDWTAELGMYAIVDYHVLTPGNPTSSQYNPSGQTFFQNISSYVKQKGYIHVLYEICNEPNGTDWGTIKNYANGVLNVIAQNDPKAVVIVGTPQWSQMLSDANNNKITHSTLQIMYTFHFYAGDHGQFLSSQFTDNMLRSIPVIVTEWSNTGASGRGSGNDYNATQFLNRCNNTGTQRVSWTAWSWSPVEWENNGERLSSAWKNGTASNSSGYSPNNLSATGKLAYDNLSQFNWEACTNTVTVTFDAGSGASTVNPQSVCVGDKAIKPADPRKTGFTFVRWMNGTTAFNFDNSVSSNLTLTAEWIEGEGNTLLFDGESEGSQTNICTWWYTATDTKASVSSPDVDEDGNLMPSEGGNPGNAMNVNYKTVVTGGTSDPSYANWGCMIGFSLSPETSATEVIPVDITGATSLQFDYKTSKAGVVVVQIQLSNGRQYEYPTKLAASTSWTAKKIVDFADFVYTDWSDGGTETLWSEDAAANAKLAAQISFAFKSSGTATEGTFSVDNIELVGKKMAACGEVIEPTCENEVIITFNNDGAEYGTVTACEGEDTFAPRDPSKDGYKFKGWSASSTGTTPVTFPVAAAAGLQFYAIWEEITCEQHTVTFVADGATFLIEKECAGEEIEQPADPTKTGYAFESWLDEAGVAVPFPYIVSGPATLTAKFIKSTNPTDPTVIADCEDENATKLLTYWYSYQAGESTIDPLASETNPFVMTEGGYDGTGYAAVATGELVNPAAPDYESAGIGFHFNTDETDYDLTGATGISFYHKGDAINFSVMLSTVTPDGGFDYSYSVKAHSSWTLVTVAFPGSAISADGELAQASWVSAAETKEWDPSKVTKLQWQIKDGKARTYSFGIDEVTVLGKALDLPTGGDPTIVPGVDAVSFSIYPNPAKDGNFNIALGDETATVSIVTLQGQTVYSTVVEGSALINADLASGVYMVLVQTENGVKAQKLIVK
jgi:uncharacterized repeat protein (TIGR02543 family)